MTGLSLEENNPEDMRGKEWPVAGILLLSGLFLLAYTSCRACLLSMTHDECMSLFNYASPGPFKVFDFSSPNNHLLNTLLMKGSSAVAGFSEISLRWPNLLAHLLYLVASWRLLRPIGAAHLVICGFALINLNPFLLDFFSLARGYGLGLGFMMLSLMLYLKFAEGRGEQTRYAMLSFIAALFAVLSNLAFLNFYAALVVTHFIVHALMIRASSEKPDRNVLGLLVKKNIHLLLNLVVVALIVIPIVHALPAVHYGGSSGFWADTVQSLISASLYDSGYASGASVWVLIAVIATLISSAAMLIHHCMKGTWAAALPMMIVFALLVLSAVSTVLQHGLFGTVYLIERTALFFIPLFGILLVQMMRSMESLGIRVMKPVLPILAAVILLLLILHGAATMNFTHSRTWKYDADNKTMMNDLIEDHERANSPEPIVRLGVTWLFEPSITYYHLRYRLKWLRKVTRNGLEGEYDYYFYAPEDADSMKNKRIEVLKAYPLSGNRLAKSLP